MAFQVSRRVFPQADSFLGLLSLGMSMGQWLCLPMIASGAVLWLWARQPAEFDAAQKFFLARPSAGSL